MSSKKAIYKRNLHRDCWNLDAVFIKWLNEHLKTYLHDANKVINLEYHTFQYHDKEYTQKELIEILIVLTDELMTEDAWDDVYIENLKEMTTIWGIILPAMWW